MILLRLKVGEKEKKREKVRLKLAPDRPFHISFKKKNVILNLTSIETQTIFYAKYPDNCMEQCLQFKSI